MKRFLIASLMIVTLVVGGTGCSKKVTVVEENPTNSTTNASTTKGSGNSKEGAPQQMAKADLRGEIVSVKGNDIEIKLIEMPEMGPRGENANNSDRVIQGDSKDVDPKKDMADGKEKGQLQKKYTGETKTISLTGETVITSMSRGGFGGGPGGRGKDTSNQQSKDKNDQSSKAKQLPEKQKLEVKDLKQGDVLQVWYKDKEKGTIDRVSVMPSFDGQKPEDKTK